MIIFAYCLAGCLVFWISFDLFQELSDLQRDQLTTLEVAEYYAWKSPDLLMIVMPVTLLSALLFVLTQHARHHELTAIRSAGVSLWRLSLPYFLVGALCSLWLFAASEVWGPRSLEEAERIRKKHQGREAAASSRYLRNFGFPSGLGRVWQADTYDVDTGDMLTVHVGWKTAEGTHREIVAQRAEWRDGVWVFQEAIDTWFTNNPAAFPFRIVTNRLSVSELTETPSQIRAALKVNDLFSNLRQAAKRPQLSLREILDYRRVYPNDTRHSAALLTQMHGRLAAPWTCVVAVFIAVPFGAASGRRNPFVGVASSMFIFFGYFILLRLGLILGTADRLPAWLAAWGPNLVFSLLGAWRMARVR
ncbi:MAG: LptF/LptG family permease [Verrucomicrobia bacterium]|nr:LptF/LptG family permease [Verrucomicrobiota bacterium]